MRLETRRNYPVNPAAGGVNEIVCRRPGREGIRALQERIQTLAIFGWCFCSSESIRSDKNTFRRDW